MSVSCCQPPALAMASLRHMPPVPEKLKSQPAAERARFSTRWWPSSMSACMRVSSECSRFRWPQRACTMPTLRVGHEVRHDRAQEVGLREEVGVEDGDELALGDLQPVVERARLVAGAIDAVDVDDVETALRAARSTFATNERPRLVGRVVEHLDLEPACAGTRWRRRDRAAGSRPSPRCRAGAGWSRAGGRGAARGLRTGAPARPP